MNGGRRERKEREGKLRCKMVRKVKEGEWREVEEGEREGDERRARKESGRKER